MSLLSKLRNWCRKLFGGLPVPPRPTPPPADPITRLLAEFDAHEDSRYFLFGAQTCIERPVTTLRLPKDVDAVNALYKGIREPRTGEAPFAPVTYDRHASTERLLSIIHPHKENQNGTR